MGRFLQNVVGNHLYSESNNLHRHHFLEKSIPPDEALIKKASPGTIPMAVPLMEIWTFSASFKAGFQVTDPCFLRGFWVGFLNLESVKILFHKVPSLSWTNFFMTRGEKKHLKQVPP